MDREELINGYFEGSLNKTELAEFEQLYNSNQDFLEQVEFERQLKRALIKQERQGIKEMFSKASTEGAIGEKHTPVIHLKILMIAASAIFLLGLSAWLFFFTPQKSDAFSIYDAYYQPYENVVHPIERGSQIQDLKTRAFTAYENEEFEKALALFKELNNKSADSYLQFYEAIVLMQLEKHDEAIPLLENYIASDGELKQRAQWYLSLSYLKTKQLEKSKSLFREIADQNGFKSKEASKILEELN